MCPPSVGPTPVNAPPLRPRRLARVCSYGRRAGWCWRWAVPGQHHGAVHIPRDRRCHRRPVNEHNAAHPAYLGHQRIQGVRIDALDPRLGSTDQGLRICPEHPPPPSFPTAHILLYLSHASHSICFCPLLQLARWFSARSFHAPRP